MSDIDSLLNQGRLADAEGVRRQTRELLASENFSTLIKYDVDTVIVNQGGELDGLYFTLSGIFHAISPATASSPHRLLGRIEPGDFIGEVSLFDPKSKASATVKAMKNASALHVTREALDAFRSAHPEQALEFVSAIARSLARRLRHANEKLL